MLLEHVEDVPLFHLRQDTGDILFVSRISGDGMYYRHLGAQTRNSRFIDIASNHAGPGFREARRDYPPGTTAGAS